MVGGSNAGQCSTALVAVSKYVTGCRLHSTFDLVLEFIRAPAPIIVAAKQRQLNRLRPASDLRCQADGLVLLPLQSSVV